MTNPFRISIGIAGQNFSVLHLQGIEKLSQPFYFEIEIFREHGSENSLLQTAQLFLSPTHTLSGIITALTTLPWNATQEKTKFIFAPKFSALVYSQHVRVFLQQSIIDILSSLLANVGYLEKQIQFNVTNTYESKPYILQVPGENDYDFLARLAAKAGLFFWSDVNTDQQEIICFADNNNAANFLSDTISYIAPSGLYPQNDGQTQQGFSYLKIISQAIVASIQAIDHDEMQPSTRLQAQQQVKNNNYPYVAQHTAYGKNTLTAPDVTQLAKFTAEHQQSQVLRLAGKSNVTELAAGKSLHLKAAGFSEKYSGDFLISSVRHFAAQNIEQQGQEIAYHNDAELLPLQNNFRSAIPDHPYVAPLFHAKIESNQDNALLDEHGRYRLRQQFDQSATSTAQASPPIPRLQPLGGNVNTSNNPPVGFHTPLLDGAEILVGCLHGDPDRPIIYTSPPNNAQLSPVTVSNRSQHRFVSSNQHELLMDDAQDNEKIQFKTANALNLLEMNAATDQHQLTLATQQGAMQWQAQQNMQLQNDDSTQEIIGNNKIKTVTQNYQLSSQTQDLQQQAATDHQFIAQQNLIHNANENLEITSQGNSQMIAEKHINIAAAGEHAHFQADNGEAQLQSTDAINIFGNGEGVLEFSQGQAGFQLTPEGVINFFGNHVTVISPQPINFKGKVNYVDDPGSGVNLHTPPIPTTLQQINDLLPDKGLLKTFNDTLTINLNFDATKQDAATNKFLEGAHYKIFSFAQTNTNPLLNCSFQGIIKNSQIILKGIDLQQDFILKITDANDQQALYIVAQNDKPCIPNNEIYISPDDTVQTFTDPNDPSDTICTRTLNLTVLHPLILFNFRVNNLPEFENFYQHAGETLSSDNIETLQNNLRYFKSPEQTADRRLPNFTDEEIAYFKANNNNVTFFIHGYNVPEGNFGKEFVLADLKTTSPRIKGFSNFNSVLFRDPEKGVACSYNNAVEYPCELVNGCDAHQWQVFMNYNLNCATGQFDHSDYRKYTHMIGIIWQGDPQSKLDYLAAVPMAKFPGHLTAQLFLQLIKAGIEVNVIAHSLGNLVLMNALEILGSKGQKIQHAFMWEAAIPDNCFSPEKPADNFSMQNYYLPHAYLGAEKFSVLYSQSDNVLGEINTSFGEETSEFFQKWRDRSTGFVPAITAAIAKYVDKFSMPTKIESAYHFAHLIGKPISWFLLDDTKDDQVIYAAAKKRMDYYQQLFIKSKGINTDGMMSISLQGQMLRMITLHSDVFKTIGYILTCELPNSELKDDFTGFEEGMYQTFIDSLRSLQHGVPPINIPPTFDSPINELTTLIITLIMCHNNDVPRPAMGYQGIKDKSSRDVLGNKYIAGDQKKWLIDHSAMKYPSDDLMKNVYMPMIYGTMNHFGRYK